MLSAFQSEQTRLLRLLYDRIYVPDSTLPEYEKHGAGTLIKELIDSGFVMVCSLTKTEKETARQLSEEIANHTLAKDKEPLNHYPEAEAMVLMTRNEFKPFEILLDEQAAREVARKHGLSVIGFAGLLIRACQAEHITPEEVRDTMFKCQSLGTHYATNFIKGIYEQLKEEIK